LASRRRRRRGLGKVLTSVERKVRRIEKRPGAKRLKRNVVTTEKIVPRAIVTKKIATDAVTANEVEFGVTVVTDTEPTEFLKEGTTWVNPDDGATQVYSSDLDDFILVTDAVAQATADGKNTIYRQTTAPTGGTYASGDIWFDTDDNNKIYRFNGTNWNEAVQLGGNALANVTANSITAGTIDASVITVSNINAGNIASGTLDVSGVIKVSSSPSATGNTARIELSSAGLKAYNGSVNTVSINSDGSASFTGTISASSFIVSTPVSDVVTGASEGLTAMQFGNGVTEDGNDQILSISTSSGIRIGTAPTATGNTARVEVNSGGFFAYNGSIATVQITSAGDATFTGNVAASIFSSTNTTNSGVTIGPAGLGADAISFYRSSAQVGYIYGSSSGFAIYGQANQNIIMPSGGSIQLQNAAGTQGLLLSSGSTVTIQNDTSTIACVRNIEVTTTSTSHNDSASGYLIGDVRLVRQA
jgi:hypothetical protein